MKKVSMNKLEMARRCAKGGNGGTLTPATSETLGGVKIGEGVNVTEDGTISVPSPTPYTPPAYSTTEHKTGRKWIDGKDVYEISFKFNTNVANTKTDSGITLPTRDKVIKLDGVLGNGVPICSYIDDKVGVLIEDGKLKYYVPSWATTSYMCLTMLYTKPTT